MVAVADEELPSRRPGRSGSKGSSLAKSSPFERGRRSPARSASSADRSPRWPRSTASP